MNENQHHSATAADLTAEVRANLDALAAAIEAARNGAFVEQVAQAAEVVVQALRDGKKVLTAGNGGSAADAAHLAEELLGRYKKTRRALPAICLSADGPAITCIANDFGFENVFARQVEALGQPGDVLVVFTTSGKSENLNRALKTAQARDVRTIAVTGADGATSAQLAELDVTVPSDDSARVQELHTFVLHSICEACDASF